MWSSVKYHQLGAVAQGQRQWAKAEEYYQQALQVYVEYDDRYNQAGPCHQFGRAAEEQRQWVLARENYLRALDFWKPYEDAYHIDMAVRSVARLWSASADAGLPAAVAEVLGVTAEEPEELLRAGLGEEAPDEPEAVEGEPLAG